MIEAGQFVAAASQAGFAWYAGVPCSFLTPFINYVIDEPTLTYVSAANEGDAVAAAAGAFVGGRLAVAMMQNSGLGNAVSPLTSLAHVFRIPMLIICTHRGAPGVQDEPQHELMGQITEQLFDTMRIPWEVFPRDPNELDRALARAREFIATESRPYALIMHKGSVAPHALHTRIASPLRERCAASVGSIVHAPTQDGRLRRAAVLKRVIELTPERASVVIASTGFAGRELYALADRPNHLYMVGSMGCASSLGLGLAMVRPDLRVVVVDGDGAALMRMGNFATLGSYARDNLHHILLDNEAHESTGAQATVAANVDFADVARACGYGLAVRGDTLRALDELFATPATANGGPRFLHMKIATGTLDELPRPAVTPPAVLARLRRHLGSVST